MGLLRVCRKPGCHLFAQLSPYPVQFLEQTGIIHGVGTRSGKYYNVQRRQLVLPMSEGFPDGSLELVASRCLGQMSACHDDSKAGRCIQAFRGGPDQHQKPAAAGSELDAVEYPRVITTVEQSCLAGKSEIRRQRNGFRRLDASAPWLGGARSLCGRSGLPCGHGNHGSACA